MLNVRIVSDGTNAGTKVFNAETGAPIQFITAISLEQRAGEPMLCSLTILCRPIEMEVIAAADVKLLALGEPD